jgi:hypothetical protein
MPVESDRCLLYGGRDSSRDSTRSAPKRTVTLAAKVE